MSAEYRFHAEVVLWLEAERHFELALADLGWRAWNMIEPAEDTGEGAPSDSAIEFEYVRVPSTPDGRGHGFLAITLAVLAVEAAVNLALHAQADEEGGGPHPSITGRRPLLEKVRALRRGLPDEAGSLEVLQRAVKLRNEFVHFKEPYSCIGRFGLSPIEAQVQEAELIAVRAACWDVLANTCALHVPDLLQRLAAREVEHRC